MKSKHHRDGRKWVYNSYQNWQEQMPFWSERTLMRVFLSLEKQGYLLTGNWNRLEIDKTKWYTIDYEKLLDVEKRMS